MFFYLVLLFTALPAAELMILIKLGQIYGLANTFLLIIGTGIIGAHIARLQGFLVLQNIQSQMNQGIMPTEEMIDGVMILAGGMALLTPGLITDILGFLLIIPLTRNFIKMFIKAKFMHSLNESSGVITIEASSSENDPDDDLS
ncbi:MAG: FxsA family protein [Candidatus Aceula meridiana]|nr:FxsA family protein [Candidatus Aceula meridiana]